MITGSINPSSNKQTFETKTLKNDNKETQSTSQSDVLLKTQSLRDDKLDEKIKKKVEEAVNNINDIVETVKEGLKFKLHEKTDRLMVQIINIETMEVIKEIPPEEMLDLSARIQEMVGILIDEKV